jgi:hypothetical protein
MGTATAAIEHSASTTSVHRFAVKVRRKAFKGAEPIDTSAAVSHLT